MVFCSSPWFPLALPSHCGFMPENNKTLCVCLFVCFRHYLRGLMGYLFVIFPTKNSVVSFCCIDAIKNGKDKEERGKLVSLKQN